MKGKFRPKLPGRWRDTSYNFLFEYAGDGKFNGQAARYKITSPNLSLAGDYESLVDLIEKLPEGLCAMASLGLYYINSDKEILDLVSLLNVAYSAQMEELTQIARNELLIPPRIILPRDGPNIRF